MPACITGFLALVDHLYAGIDQVYAANCLVRQAAAIDSNAVL